MSRTRRGRQAGPSPLDHPPDVGPGLPAHAAPVGERTIEGAGHASCPPSGSVAADPIALAVAVLARTTIAPHLAKVGHPGATLDDAYIHFQYARAIAEGHPFRFQAGEPATSGATSLLWPALLAPFWSLGFRGEAILWPAWALSFVALGALAWEARAMTRELAGEAAAIGAAAMDDRVPRVHLVRGERDGGRAVRVAARARGAAGERVGGGGPAPGEDDAGGARQSCVAARDGCADSLFRARGGARERSSSRSALARFPRESSVAIARVRAGRRSRRSLATPCSSSPSPGSATSTTAAVKLLPGNPYYAGAALVAAVARERRGSSSARSSNGEVYSAEFLPHGGAPFAFAGLARSACSVARTQARWRAARRAALALTMFAPCAYYTFLWNRLRYLWPFATGWLIGLACLARLAGDALAARFAPRWRVVDAARVRRRRRASSRRSSTGRSTTSRSRRAGSIASRSRSGGGRRRALPPSARIGVNDTGAIAYFGDRATFDVVGPDDRGRGALLGRRRRIAARALRAPPGDDTLGAPDPLHRLPRVDRAWTRVLGARAPRGDRDRRDDPRRHDDARLRGRLLALGSGETPVDADGDGTIVDCARRRRPRERGGARLRAPRRARRRGDRRRPASRPTVTRSWTAGGRCGPTSASSRIFTPERGRARVVRLEAAVPTRVHVRVGGREVALFEVEPEAWTEAHFDVPAASERWPETAIELVTEGGALTVFHYWFGAPP